MDQWYKVRDLAQYSGLRVDLSNRKLEAKNTNSEKYRTMFEKWIENHKIFPKFANFPTDGQGTICDVRTFSAQLNRA
jgi:hypothetical protein